MSLGRDAAERELARLILVMASMVERRMSARDFVRVGEEEHGVALGAALDALVNGGNEARSPGRLACGGAFAAGEERDEAWVGCRSQ